jgi:ribosome-associated protein
VLLDVTGLTSIADYFVICSGGSERQLAAIAEAIAERVADLGVKPYAREGSALSHWVLVDLGSVIVHVFAPPERDFYQLERLWSQAKTVIRVQ